MFLFQSIDFDTFVEIVWFAENPPFSLLVAQSHPWRRDEILPLILLVSKRGNPRH